MERDNEAFDVEYWLINDQGEPVSYYCTLRLTSLAAHNLLEREARSGAGALYSLFGSRDKLLKQVRECLDEHEDGPPRLPQIRITIEAADQNGDWQPVQTSLMTEDQAERLAMKGLVQSGHTLSDAIEDEHTREQIERWCVSGAKPEKEG
jgi:hypothetical protein